MKNTWFFAFFLITSSIFAQTNQQINIYDYFPAKNGQIRKYVDQNGQEIVTETVRMTDSERAFIFVTEKTFKGSPTAITFYSIETNNKVYIALIRNPFGERKPVDYIILDVPGRSWQYKEGTEITFFESSRSSVTVAGKNYADCILVSERTQYYEGRTLVEKKKRIYYAKGYGPVYEEIYSEEKGWYFNSRIILE